MNSLPSPALLLVSGYFWRRHGDECLLAAIPVIVYNSSILEVMESYQRSWKSHWKVNEFHIHVSVWTLGWVHFLSFCWPWRILVQNGTKRCPAHKIMFMVPVILCRRSLVSKKLAVSSALENLPYECYDYSSVSIHSCGQEAATTLQRLAGNTDHCLCNPLRSWVHAVKMSLATCPFQLVSLDLCCLMGVSSMSLWPRLRVAWWPAPIEDAEHFQ